MTHKQSASEQLSKLKSASKYCDIYFTKLKEYQQEQQTDKFELYNVSHFKLSSEDAPTFNKGLKIFNELTNRPFSNKLRLEALLGLMKYAEDEFFDKTTRIRDCLTFLEGKDLAKEIELLNMLMKEPSVNPRERFFCPLALFNNGLPSESQQGFAYLAQDGTMPFIQRVDACRYLIFSEDDKYYVIAKNTLTKLIDDMSISSEKRYTIIASFNSQTGLSSMYNNNVLLVDFKEDLIYDLQKMFFNNAENRQRDRILSGQTLIELSMTTQEEKDVIFNVLLSFGSEYTETSQDKLKTLSKEELEELKNKCADSADVVLRLGSIEQKTKAREIIERLGGDNTANIYADEQNIHNESITEAINNFIEEILLKTSEKIEKYEDCIQEINEMIYNENLSPKDKNLVFKAINRINMDTAKFTSHNVTSAEILIHVWMRVKSHKNSDELKKRLIEELVEMSGTCSTGVGGRIINTLSGYYGSITIGWKDQVQSNMYARIQKRIQDIKDEDLQTSILMGMAETSDNDDRKAYMKFLRGNLTVVYKELYDEFCSYISKEEFISHFKTGMFRWGLDPANPEFLLPF